MVFWKRLYSLCAVAASLILLAASSPLHSFDKVVIWGHKLHTHSYVHNAFYKAFHHLGYETHWFEDGESVEGFDFSNTLFITEGQVDNGIPLRSDCRYILHNCPSDKYNSLPLKNRICLQVYTDDVREQPSFAKVAPCIYYDVQARCVIMPWATDLLPHEIDEVKKKCPLQKKPTRSSG